MKIIYIFFFLAFLTNYISAQTTVLDSFVHNGLMRKFSFYVPASYDGTRAFPLVFNLHGYSSAGWQQSFYGDFKPIADTADFIVVHPEGTVVPGATQQFWNVGFFPSNVDDVGFIETLIDSISANYNINQNRVYSTGMSNGGYMSYHLACNSDRFTAIASVTGSMTTGTFNNCNPSKPTPVMQIHGTADPTVPYSGGNGSLHIDSVVAYWVNFNNCPATPNFSNVPNTNLTDGATAEHYVYNAGNANATVEFFKVIGGAHTWPGASYIIGVTCQDFKASQEIWRFFNQYGTTTAVNNTQTEQIFKLAPNPANDILYLNVENNEGFYTIFDLNGRLISNAKVVNQQTQIDVQNLPKGLYILEFKSERTTQSQKFIKF
jgi:polyhydroxybutyrate depolymerase